MCFLFFDTKKVKLWHDCGNRRDDTKALYEAECSPQQKRMNPPPKKKAPKHLDHMCYYLLERTLYEP